MEEYGSLDTSTLKEKLEIPSKEPEDEDPMTIRQVPGTEPPEGEPQRPEGEPPQPGLEEAQRLGFLTRKILTSGGNSGE